MNRPNVARWALLLLAFAALLLPRTSWAQPAQIDLGDLFSQETQRRVGIGSNSGQVGVIWWMPDEFWATLLPGGLTQERFDRIAKSPRPYLLFGVVQGILGPADNVTHASEEKIRNSFTILDQEGKSYSPLREEEIDPNVKKAIAAFKPLTVNLLGPLGTNFYIYVFPNKSASGKIIADPRAEGNLVVKLAEQRYEWRLPLSSLVPQKTCPQDKELLSGAWSYCPWHGTKLVPAGQP